MNITANDLLSIIDSNLTAIRNNLDQQGFEYAYGSNYSIDEIRKAIIDKKPSFITYNKKVFLAVGENPDSLILFNGKQAVEISDKQLQKAWEGDSIIVQDRIDPEPDITTVRIDRNPEEKFIITAPDRDSWTSDWQDIKIRALSLLDKLKLGRPYLPPHPIILIFKTPTETIIKEQIREVISGAEITIYDPTDPVSETLHAIGHLYWNICLTIEERKEWEKYYSRIKKKESAIFSDKYSLKTFIECFCTIYLWFLKGIILNPGYFKILEYHEPEGLKLLHNTIDRITAEILARDEWAKMEQLIYDYLNSKQTFNVGGRIIKAKMNIEKPEPCRIPKWIDKEYIETVGDIDYVTPLEGLLKGFKLPVKDGWIVIEEPNDPTLQKATSKKKIKIFIDLDGVLTDFNRQFRKYFKKNPDYIEPESEKWKLIDKIDHFWRDMEWTRNGKQLWDTVKDYDVTVISTPAYSVKQCVPDKKEWVRRELGKDVKLILDTNKSKHVVPNAILIDDMDKNIDSWKEAGGIGIKHANISTTLSVLRNLVNGHPELQKAIPDLIPVKKFIRIGNHVKVLWKDPEKQT